MDTATAVTVMAVVQAAEVPAVAGRAEVVAEAVPVVAAVEDAAAVVVAGVVDRMPSHE